MKNPPWTRDEIILALDQYFKLDLGKTSVTDKEIVDLSELLSSLPIHSSRPDERKFRNPNGVLMKMMNLRAFDPTYDGKGLKAGSKLDKEVWDEYSVNRGRLIETAKLIREGQKLSTQCVEEQLIMLADEEEFPEGKLLTRAHKVRERKTSASKKKKKLVLVQTGRLSCEVCGFDFSQTYGELGEGFIECHHVSPLADLGKEAKTKLSDLALVCSNCHRMLHRVRPWCTISELKSILNRQKH